MAAPTPSASQPAGRTSQPAGRASRRPGAQVPGLAAFPYRELMSQPADPATAPPDGTPKVTADPVPPKQIQVNGRKIRFRWLQQLIWSVVGANAGALIIAALY